MSNYIKVNKKFINEFYKGNMLAFCSHREYFSVDPYNDVYIMFSDSPSYMIQEVFNFK